MLVCWEWLQEYVDLDVSHEDLALQFAMSGLNHESTEQVGQDTVIDLEVTSNRGDCLGHLGVAREASVLLDTPLKIPQPKPEEDASAASASIQVENLFPEGCPEYSARVIRGVKIGQSPAWLVRRLNAIGVESVNNVVDITNYVMMECGQPLHAFDLAKIQGQKIIVRPAKDGEEFLAIDHRTYELDPQMVVIADANRAVALGGVMGGADSEISDNTTDLLIEAARFTPLAIRRAARKLKLHSPSSYRFERTTDPGGLEWASLRCCELILELCGGTLEKGVVSAGASAPARDAIPLRIAQVERVLGIPIPSQDCERILIRLGCEVCTESDLLHVTPPSFRTDLERECDLIEEVARMHGYEQIPENVAVPIGVASPRPKDTTLARARLALSAYGVDEAMTPSVVSEHMDAFCLLWSQKPALTVDTPLLKGAKSLRRSIVPSLLDARHYNQTQSVRNAELFEVATIFLADPQSELPREQCTLGMVTAGDLQRVKGVVEAILREVAGQRKITWQPIDNTFFAKGTGQLLTIDGERLGFTGLVSQPAQHHFSLDQPVAAAEISVDQLTRLLQPVRRADRVSTFPAVDRDLNFIVDETVQWAELANTCTTNAGEILDAIEYRETYRDAKKDGPGKKRLLLTLRFRSLDRTLTGDEVDQAVHAVVSACETAFGAKLLS